MYGSFGRTGGYGQSVPPVEDTYASSAKESIFDFAASLIDPDPHYREERSGMIAETAPKAGPFAFIGKWAEGENQAATRAAAVERREEWLKQANLLVMPALAVTAIYLYTIKRR